MNCVYANRDYIIQERGGIVASCELRVLCFDWQLKTDNCKLS